MNFIHVAGHLGADPEVRFTSSGQKVITLRLAAKARRSGKDETIWWRITIWGEQFDKMMPYLKKGSSIIVMGEMNKPEIFTDREGKAQVSMGITASNITFSPFGRTEKQQDTQTVASAPVAEGVATGTNVESNTTDYSMDDEIPF